MKKFNLWILFILINQVIFSQNIVSDTISHSVERKETLFSISQKYDIDINDILELNPELRDSRLRRRSIILIPVFTSIQEIQPIKLDSLRLSNSILTLDSIYSKKRKKNDRFKCFCFTSFQISINKL